jgi:ferritin
MNQKLLDEMNVQINKELYSGYLYMSMAAHFAQANLGGFSHWMKIQAKEELDHAMKFFDFLNELGVKAELQAIAQPDAKFGSPVKVFEQVLEHEIFVTTRIHLLYEIAVAEKDYPAQVFLQWFINEQVEEEKHATEILETLKLGGDSGSALIMMDKALGAR